MDESIRYIIVLGVFGVGVLGIILIVAHERGRFGPPGPARRYGLLRAVWVGLLFLALLWAIVATGIEIPFVAVLIMQFVGLLLAIIKLLAVVFTYARAPRSRQRE